jgi:hypothetical protein
MLMVINSVNSFLRPTVAHIENEYEFQQYVHLHTRIPNSRKKAFFVSRSFHAEANETIELSLPRIMNEVFTIPTAFNMIKNNFMVNHFDGIQMQLLETGFGKYHIEFAKWLNLKPHVEEKVDSRRIFALKDLEYGFVLWLAACFVSFLVFVYEINSLRLRRKLRVLIGLIDFLRLLRARMADYHDSW